MKRISLIFAIILSLVWIAGLPAQNLQTTASDSLQMPPSEEKIPDPGTFVPFDTPPRQINDVPQIWPENATQDGRVTVQYFVDKKGFPRQVRTLKAVPQEEGFEEAAVQMIQRMRFTPAQRNGEAVGIWVAQVINFKKS